ncbi:hypothetical protein [Phenylobacterium sp.]|uniref:hypothetical protein n=1 Tax=Phenylobacterium sp. TaxID=1871053 RepID=UPI0011F9A417|nr:hypothetical protein [Phenylobacterium sp.]THD64762.1 MAG: hypothetical protein E8A49_01560 [Phenylobacterium sp.]
MRKTLTAALAALTLGGAISAAAVTGAEARPFYHHGGGHGGAVVAGVAGLALGAALASNHPYYGYGYGPGPYAYGYGPGYYGGTCFTTRWVWDPYAGRRIPERVPFAC